MGLPAHWSFKFNTALEQLRSQVLRCFGGFVQVRKLCDMVSGCGSTASPILIWGSLPTLYYISWAEDLPPGASWFSQPLGLDGCFSSFKEGVNDLRCCSNAHSVWFCCFERGLRICISDKLPGEADAARGSRSSFTWRWDFALTVLETKYLSVNSWE